jgi:hypothetical protein
MVTDNPEEIIILQRRTLTIYSLSNFSRIQPEILTTVIMG